MTFFLWVNTSVKAQSCPLTLLWSQTRQGLNQTTFSDSPTSWHTCIITGLALYESLPPVRWVWVCNVWPLCAHKIVWIIIILITEPLWCNFCCCYGYSTHTSWLIWLDNLFIAILTLDLLIVSSSCELWSLYFEPWTTSHILIYLLSIMLL